MRGSVESGRESHRANRDQCLHVRGKHRRQYLVQIGWPPPAYSPFPHTRSSGWPSLALAGTIVLSDWLCCWIILLPSLPILWLLLCWCRKNVEPGKWPITSLYAGGGPSMRPWLQELATLMPELLLGGLGPPPPKPTPLPPIPPRPPPFPMSIKSLS